MTREEAHRLLNSLKDGMDASADQIRDALTATGDLGAHEELRGQTLGEEVQRDQVRRWFYCGTRLVAEDLTRH